MCVKLQLGILNKVLYVIYEALTFTKTRKKEEVRFHLNP